MIRGFGNTFRSYNCLYNNRPMSEEEMQRVAPSIFAAEKHESRSGRYAYIPTIEVLRGLQKEGFQPFQVFQSNCRDEGKTPFTKHMIRLRHEGTQLALNGCHTEVVMVNSHDGTSSFHLMPGLFEKVCENGLVVHRGNMQERKVYHKGDVQGQVIDAAYEVVDELKSVADRRDAMRVLSMNRDESRAMAEAALVLRFGEEKTPPIRPEQMLTVRHREQQEPNLWNVFNVIQENTIRGGLHGRSQNNRRMTTRDITGINQNVNLNKALWLLAERMRELKSNSPAALAA